MKPTALHIISGLQDGGAEASLFRLCRNEPRFAHRVVSMMDEGKYGPLLRESGIPVYALGMPRGRLTITALFRLYRILRKEKPDVVQTWMYHADLIGGVMARMVSSAPVFWNIRHGDLRTGGVSRSAMLSALVCARLSRSVPRRIICCAGTAADSHAELGYDSARMTVIPNGIDIDHFQPNKGFREQIRTEFGIEPNTVLLGNIGRFNPAKNHEGLLQTLAVLRDRGIRFRCLLAGAKVDQDNSVLSNSIERHKLEDQVIMAGPRTDVEKIMNAIDIYVSSSRVEGFPNVLAEAMACGTPCVTTNAGDASRIIGDYGWLVPVDSQDALVKAIEEALAASRHADCLQARQSAGINYIRQEFSLERMQKAYTDLWSLEIALSSTRLPAF